MLRLRLVVIVMAVVSVWTFSASVQYVVSSALQFRFGLGLGVTAYGKRGPYVHRSYVPVSLIISSVMVTIIPPRPDHRLYLSWSLPVPQSLYPTTHSPQHRLPFSLSDTPRPYYCCCCCCESPTPDFRPSLSPQPSNQTKRGAALHYPQQQPHSQLRALRVLFIT